MSVTSNMQNGSDASFVRTRFQPQARHQSQRKQLRKGNGGKPSLYKPMYCRDAYVAFAAGEDYAAVARLLGVGTYALKSWEQDFPEFQLAIQRGRDDYSSGRVERALKRRALGYDYVEETVEDTVIKGPKGSKSSAVEVPAIKVKRSTRHIPADTTAMIFYLTNRNAARWKNTKYVTAGGDPDNPVQHNHNLVLDLTKMSVDELKNLRSVVERHTIPVDSGDRRTLDVEGSEVVHPKAVAVRRE